MKSKYESNIKPYLSEIRTWAERGVTEADIAGNLSLGYSTFRKYKSLEPELKAALDEGKSHVRQDRDETYEAPPVGSYSAGGKNKRLRADHEGPMRRAYAKNKRKILATQTVCGICGKPVDKSLKFPNPLAPTVDHIIPVARGGHPSDIDNLQLAHWTCNRQKSDKIVKTVQTEAKPQVLSNRLLPQSRDWAKYRPAGKK